MLYKNKNKCYNEVGMSNIDDTNEDTLELTGSIEYFDNSYQENGTLIPYFMIYSVKIDKEEVERLLK